MWLYNGELIDDSTLEDYIGFVYVITRLDNDKRYIGKKLLKFKRTKKVKGKKKRFLIESDWQTYWGSNKTLLQEVSTLGESAFRREIVRLCRTRGECNYHEAKLQFENGVLESNMWYNDHILVRVHRSHIKPKEKKTDIIKLSS
jgi:hypothetical protein